MRTLTAVRLTAAGSANPSNHQSTGHGTTAIVVVVIGVLVVAAVVAFNVMRSRRRDQ